MDLIGRQQALDKLTENKEMLSKVLDSLMLDYITRNNMEQSQEQIDEDIETIKALPSVQPEISYGVRSVSVETNTDAANTGRFGDGRYSDCY